MKIKTLAPIFLTTMAFVMYGCSGNSAEDNPAEAEQQQQQEQGETEASPDNPMAALAAAAQAMEAAQKQAAAAGGVTPTANVVGWRELKPFLPDEVGPLKAQGDVDGSTNTMGAAMKVSEVKRKYKAGKTVAKVKLVDVSMAPMLSAPFAMASMMQEDSSKGFKKGTKIDGHNAIVEWRKKRAKSSAMVLIANRFLLEVDIKNASSDNQAQEMASKLDLAEIAKLAPTTK